MSTFTQSTFKVGDVLDGKWVILGFIGKGGMGEVYRAHQLNLDRDVAIKIISPLFLEELSDDEYESEACFGRFHREVNVMAQVRHPNVLQTFDCGSVKVRKGKEEICVEYIAMEYIPGGTLRSTMSVEGFHPEEDRTRDWLVSYFLPLLDGVCALHERGIVHRDLKPENVLLDGKVPKIADFGLARSHRSTPFTQSMDMKGTPPYMSPEHFLDLKRADERADVYSLGKILYEAVSGKISSDQIPFKKASLPGAATTFFQELDRIIQSATEEDRNVRTSSVQAMKEGIEEALKALDAARQIPSAPKSSGRASWWRAHALTALVVVLLSVSIGIGISLFHGKGKAPDPAAQGKLFGSLVPGQLAPSSDPPPMLRGTDEDVMRLIPAGSITLPQEPGKGGAGEIKVESFYLDEMQVTNHQYVEFLNSVLSRIKVESGVVRGDGEVWLLLGQVMPRYEPIVYRDGRFHIQNAAHASCPVLRVTGYGASAYVHFYGRRLPTEIEWLYVVRQGGKAENGAASGEPATSHGMHMGEASVQEGSEDRSGSHSSGEAMMPSPVITQKPNSLGIRGMDGKMGEWALSGLGDGTQGTGRQDGTYVVVGGPMAPGSMSLPGFIPRQPWEAFEEVGFRCALSLPKGSGADVS